MLKDNLFTFNHCDIFCSSSLVWYWSTDQSLPLENKFELFANKKGIVYLHTLAKSFIYDKNNTGPKIEPWGTPHDIVLMFDETLTYDTYCLQLDK